MSKISATMLGQIREGNKKKEDGKLSKFKRIKSEKTKRLHE